MAGPDDVGREEAARARSVYRPGEMSENEKVPSGAIVVDAEAVEWNSRKDRLSARHQADARCRGAVFPTPGSSDRSVDARRRHDLQREIDAAPLLAAANRQDGRLCGHSRSGIERGRERNRLRWRGSAAAIRARVPHIELGRQLQLAALRSQKCRPPRCADNVVAGRAGRRFGTHPCRRLPQTIDRTPAAARRSASRSASHGRSCRPTAARCCPAGRR